MVVRTGLMTDARDLLPCDLVDGREMRVALGGRVYFGDFEPVGYAEELRIDFGAAEHGDVTGAAPRGVRLRKHARRLERRGCDDAGAAEIADRG